MGNLLQRANSKRVNHDYSVNGRVMAVEYGPTKLGAREGKGHTWWPEAPPSGHEGVCTCKMERVGTRGLHPYQEDKTMFEHQQLQTLVGDMDMVHG